MQGRIQDFQRRGRQPSNGERQHMNFPNFLKKLHEIKNILGRKRSAYDLANFSEKMHETKSNLSHRSGGAPP